MSTVTIPLEVDDATPVWLSDALGRDVVDVEILDAHSGTTGRARLGLRYGDGNEGPPSVFLKLAPFDERQRSFVDMVGLGTAEARFYRDVATDVPVRVPTVHCARLDDGGRYVMLLEDLEATGCRFPSPSDDDLVDTMTAIVDGLARLHVQYWGDARLEDGGDLAWVRDGYRVAFGSGAQFVEKALGAFGDQMSQDFRRLAEITIERPAEVAGLLASGPPTLIHGDPHLGNLFVDPGRSGRDRVAGFFDWGMVWRATGMRDVAYVLGNSVPTEVRREHERDWVQQYVDLLAAHEIALSFDDAWRQYRLLVIYSWNSATSTAAMGSRWQAIDVGRGGMARATTAVEDLGSVELLEELLR
jgi:aminoglycoside phosphotransferase (APT) family kinase protein